jgi:hypothetical protein
MKKTATLKNAETSERLKVSLEFIADAQPEPGFEPDAQTISNILNYSKALRIQPSALIDHIVTINN